MSALPARLDAVRASAREAARQEMAASPPAPLSEWPAGTAAALRALLAGHEDAVQVTARGRQQAA